METKRKVFWTKTKVTVQMMVWSFGIEKKKEKKKQAKDGISRNGNAMEGEGRNANDESTNENKLMT